jgi:hypothetical protein
VLLAAIPFLAGAWFYGVYWLDLFPLIEYRNWLWYPFEAGRSIPELLRHLVAQEGAFARDVSLFEVQLTALGCGLGYRCVNAVPLALLLVTDVLLYFLIRRLVGSRPLAFGAACLWVMSHPVVDAAAWQATNHDKVAVLLTVATLHVLLYFLKGPATPLRIVAGNLAIGSLVVLAYNSKEAAWALLPCGLLLGLVAFDRPTPGGFIRGQLPYFVLPLLYAVHQNLRYFAFFQEDHAWKVHVTSGPPLRNTAAYLAFLANQPVFSWFALQPTGAVVAATALAWRFGERRRARVACWAALACVLSAALVLRLQYPSGYHMVVPSVYLYLMGAAAFSSLLEGNRTPAWRRAVALGLPAATAAYLLMHGVRAYPDYEMRRARSARFVATLPVVAKYVPVAGEAPIHLVTPDSRYDAYMFLGATDARDIYPYIYGDPHADPAFEARFRDLPQSAYDVPGSRQADAYYVVFDDGMGIAEIDLGSRTLYRSQGAR